MTPFHVLILLILILIVGGIVFGIVKAARRKYRAANKAQGSASLGLACAC
jgi:hypothetical protein